MDETGRSGISDPSMRVIERVADTKGVSIQELSPLYETIDPDALNDLFRNRTSTGTGSGYVQFDYEGHTVIVDSDGRVGVSETEG